MILVIRNDNGVLTVSDEDKNIAWQTYHEKFLNTDFTGDTNALSQADTVSIVPRLIDKGMVIK